MKVSSPKYRRNTVLLSMETPQRVPHKFGGNAPKNPRKLPGDQEAGGADQALGPDPREADGQANDTAKADV